MARRPWGQHFLRDRNYAHKIVRALEVKDGDSVLEIGPGKGALTSILTKTGARLTLVEVDEKMMDILRERYSESSSLKIIHADFLRVSYTELTQRTGEAFKVVSNLPYQSSTAILLKLFREIKFPTRMVLMFQKEVAERLSASPKSRAYGRLSVLTQLYSQVKKLCHVPKQAFYPAPEVESSVLQFDLHPEAFLPQSQLSAFENFLAQSFQYKRKMLRNNLKASCFGLKKSELDEKIVELGFSLRVRAEEMSLSQHLSLFHELRA